jgi:hypothetical protein
MDPRIRIRIRIHYPDPHQNAMDPEHCIKETFSVVDPDLLHPDQNPGFFLCRNPDAEMDSVQAHTVLSFQWRCTGTACRSLFVLQMTYKEN